jgi:predicted DNA-binding transcriptional regulator YafY
MDIKEVKILYKNWKGETKIRKIIPKEIIFSSNEWHKEEQWILIAFDVDKQAERNFACKDIKAWFLE